MKPEDLVPKYIASLERENNRFYGDLKDLSDRLQRCLEELSKRNQKIEDLESKLSLDPKAYDEALEKIDKRDTILWKIGIEANIGTSDILNKLKDMTEKAQSEMDPDLEKIVGKLYSEFGAAKLAKKSVPPAPSATPPLLPQK